MDEKILLRFEHDGKPMKVVSFAVDEGVTFDKPKDASPLNIAFGLQALLPGRLDPVRLRHDWRNKEFALDASVEDGGILLSGFHGDREGLPFGAYDVTVEVESYRFENPQQRIVLKQGKRDEILLVAKPDPHRIALLNNFDAPTGALVNNSSIDGQSLSTWLASTTPRAARQACLLNILTKLAAPPMPGIKKGLNTRFASLHFGEVDRVYAAADPAIASDLEELVKKDGWVAEGRPKHPIHEKVIEDALKRFKTELKGKKKEDFTLTSYRQGGRTSLQVVLAIPKFSHPVVYTDVDIDLGNPLWDLDGFVVHLGELLDPSATDHFDVREKLNRGVTKDFVFYRVV